MTDTTTTTTITDEPEVDGELDLPEAQADDQVDEQPETFDREYVQKLRDEAAGHRVKAKRADALAAALVTAQAAVTRRLADPTDLPYSDDLLDDDGLVDVDKVRAAVDELISAKPHLAARRPRGGDVGQGARPEPDDTGLAGLLRRGA